MIVWDAATGKLQQVFQGHLKEVTCVAVRADGLQIASASEDGSIRLWPLTTADEHRSLTEATDNLWNVAYAPDGRTFASGGADRTIRVYETATGKLLQELKGHKACRYRIGISHAEQTRILGGRQVDQNLGCRFGHGQGLHRAHFRRALRGARRQVSRLGRHR